MFNIDDNTIDQIIEGCYEAYDIDRSGYLESKEIRNLMNSICEAESITITQDQIKMMFKVYDRNKDGKFEKKELREL